MREAEIRRILKDVCDAIDRTRAAHIALGVAVAVGAAGCQSEPKPAGAPTSQATDTGAPSAADTNQAAVDSASQAAVDSPLVTSDDPNTVDSAAREKYGATFDSDAQADTIHRSYPKYGVVHPTGPVVRYGVPDPNSL
jgi:hypothetical protein